LCRAFDGPCFGKKIKILSFSQVERYAKQKSLRNIFIMLGSSTIMWVIYIDYEKNRQNQLIGISLCSFCRAFYGASFEEKTRF
jgi:hypothetical protein